ncbi:MAG TPA: HEAT repeat domain-containing protein, partial [Ktedonobacterales bacterium]|nr:HEAT repeat domain-containing protein [Ktedonobacterales bacterium]
RDPRWQVRTTAALSLGRLKQRTPVEPLVMALNDADESVRAAAAWALGRLGQRTPVEPLAAALRDNAWPVREAAALALKALGRRAPAALLLTAQMDEDRQVREAAGWALAARFGPLPGLYDERNRTMSQRVDFDQQRAYQDPHEYQGALYQEPSGHYPALFGLSGGQPGTAEPTPPRYRLAVALGSLLTLLAVLVTLVASLHTTDSGFVFLAALIGLGMICATIAAINFAFNFRR